MGKSSSGHWMVTPLAENHISVTGWSVAKIVQGWPQSKNVAIYSETQTGMKPGIYWVSKPADPHQKFLIVTNTQFHPKSVTAQQVLAALKNLNPTILSMKNNKLSVIVTGQKVTNSDSKITSPTARSPPKQLTTESQTSEIEPEQSAVKIDKAPSQKDAMEWRSSTLIKEKENREQSNVQLPSSNVEVSINGETNACKVMIGEGSTEQETDEGDGKYFVNTLSGQIEVVPLAENYVAQNGWSIARLKKCWPATKNVVIYTERQTDLKAGIYLAS